MKKLLYILSIILLSAPVSFALAEEPAEAVFTPLFSTFDWEREADARIWSDRVVKDFKSGSLSGFKINALCDESAYNEIEEIKKLSLEVIKNDINYGAWSSEGALALKIYKKAEEYLPAGDDIAGSRTIALFEFLPQRERSHSASGLAGSGYPDIPVILHGFSASVTVNAGSAQLKKHESDPDSRVKASYLICRSPLNLSLLWDMEKSDYYRIFLYIRDDDRIKDLSLNIIFPPSSVLLRHLYFRNSNIRTEIHSRTKLNNKINYKRLTLVRHTLFVSTEAGPPGNFKNHSIYTSGVLL